MSSIVDKKDTVEYITSLHNILYSKTNFNQLLAKGNIEKTVIGQMIKIDTC